MNITSILILTLAIIFGVVTTLFIAKIILSRIEFNNEEKIGSYFKYSSILIGAALLLKPCVDNIVYTTDILVTKDFDFKNYEFFKLLLIYFIVYYIAIFVINFLSNKIQYILISKEIKDQNLKYVVSSLLFIILCFLTLPLIEIIFNYYKPTVETQFYR